jgi:hypothetical protein
MDQGSTNVFHSPPFRQKKERSRGKPQEAKEELEGAAILEYSTDVQQCESTRSAAPDEQVAASRASAQNNKWIPSGHTGLLCLHDGTKKWYHCELCDYRNDRLYHSKMHFQRIHINNGKSMPRKRKYTDGPEGPGPADLTTLAKLTKKPTTPSRTPTSPGKTAGYERANFSTPSSRAGKRSASSKVRNVRIMQTSDATHPDDARAVLNNSVKYEFGGGSVGGQNGEGPGWSINAGEMSVPSSLPAGRSTIGGASSARTRKPKVARESKGQLLAPAERQDEGVCAEGLQATSDPPVSPVRRQGSPGKSLRSPPISAPSTPSRQGFCRPDDDAYTPIINARLRSFRSATPESKLQQLLQTPSAAVEYRGSPATARRNRDDLYCCEHMMSADDMRRQGDADIAGSDLALASFDSVDHQVFRGEG